MIGKNFSNGWKIPAVFSNDWKLFSQWLENFSAPGRALHPFLATKNTKGTKFPTPFVFFVAETPPPPGRCGILPRHRAREGQGLLEKGGHGLVFCLLWFTKSTFSCK